MSKQISRRDFLNRVIAATAAAGITGIEESPLSAEMDKIEDSIIAKKVLKDAKKRERPWRG